MLTFNGVLGQMKPLTAQEQEDEDLQKAMAMSMNHNVDGQEMGWSCEQLLALRDLAMGNDSYWTSCSRDIAESRS